MDYTLLCASKCNNETLLRTSHLLFLNYSLKTTLMSTVHFVGICISINFISLCIMFISMFDACKYILINGMSSSLGTAAFKILFLPSV